MGFIEAVLALMGLLTVIGAVVRWYSQQAPELPILEEDLAAPYRQGLHAAISVQRPAQDLEEQIYAEAARHAADESGVGSTRS
jgi:hypothetical protein